MGTACTKMPKIKSAPQQVDRRQTTTVAPAKVDGNVVLQDSTTQNLSSSADPSVDGSAVEFTLCNVEDIKENEMKVFDAGEGRVLVVKEQGQFHAMGAKCTHYGAPLNTGIFCKGKIYCPWHGACFNAKTGDIEEFPALDPIPVYPVRVDPKTREVKVKISSSKMLNARADVKPLSKAAEGTDEVVLIVGSGAAGHSCAETLRQEGYTGRVIIVTKDQNLPYDRTKLSKAMNLDGAKLALRSDEYYKKGDIEFVLEVGAEALDVGAKTLLLSNGGSITYTHLVIATGGRPRPVPCPGTHLENVFLLRTPTDANRLDEAVNQECHVVIIGTSFIGMEAAAYLVDKAASVTVIGRSSTPFANVFGPLIGKRLQEMHEDKGVKFILGDEVAKMVGDDEGKLSEVVLTSGQVLPAHVLLAGLGVLPCTDFLRASDVTLDGRGYVPVDEFMRTNAEGVYAVGDIASFPFRQDRGLVNIGHWSMALHHGRAAALAILGRPRPIYETAVPFFWSSMFGKSVRYCGYAPDFDDVVIHGDLENLKFAGFLCKADIVHAVVTMNYDPLAIQFSALSVQGKSLAKSDIISSPIEWTHLLT